MGNLLVTFGALEIILITWYVSLLILTIYYLVVFIPRPGRHKVNATAPLAGVSVVIPVKNGSALLKRNLPTILRQQYHPFEIIVVNDHSELSERERLNELAQQFPQIKLIHSDQPPGKKFALMMGIEHANHPWILCTDVDCMPVSELWISGMLNKTNANANAKAKAKEVVIGYSPYEVQPGWLNKLIRFDTIITAMQYMSWTRLKRPYMAVGRNLLFTKNAFQQLDPFRNNLHIPFGDDDTLIQAARGKYAIGISDTPGTFVQSAPATTWKQWFSQKHRHLAAGINYSPTLWWQTGLFGMALIAQWILALWLLICYYHAFILLIILAGLGIRWVIAGLWMKRLRDPSLIPVYPLLEVAYSLYLITMGFFTLFKKRRTWN